MDPLSSDSSARLGSASPSSLEQDLGSLRLAVQIMLISLVILSGSVGIYLFRQVSLLRRQTETSGRLAQQMAQHFNVNLATQAQEFEKKLQAFAATNLDFQMRISRYFAPTLEATPAQGAPPATP